MHITDTTYKRCYVQITTIMNLSILQMRHGHLMRSLYVASRRGVSRGCHKVGMNGLPCDSLGVGVRVSYNMYSDVIHICTH